MGEVNTVENIRLWLRDCPAVSKTSRFNVDYMGADPTEYAIYSVPSTIDSGIDILGNVYYKPRQELNFIFASVHAFSFNALENLRNLGFYDDVIRWIYQQNVMKNFPEIAEGRVLSIMPTLTPYLFDADSDSGRYQISLKMIYRMKGV